MFSKKIMKKIPDAIHDCPTFHELFPVQYNNSLDWKQW